MISDQARRSIEQIFIKAAKARLVLDSGDFCDVAPLGGDKAGEMPEKNIVVLTISSILFRLLLIFHVDESPTTRAYFVRDAGDKSFAEVFSEIGNLCCGAMNRELLSHFPDLGMSTPTLLSSRCVSFLGELQPGYLARFAITINGAVELHASICLSGYAPLDFAVDLCVAEEETGVLEMF